VKITHNLTNDTLHVCNIYSGSCGHTNLTREAYRDTLRAQVVEDICSIRATTGNLGTPIILCGDFNATLAGIQIKRDQTPTPPRYPHKSEWWAQQHEISGVSKREGQKWVDLLQAMDMDVANGKTHH
jgi:exonuclease III